MTASEYQIQVAIFLWMDLHRNRYPNLDLSYSTASGVKMPIGLLMKCKRTGIVKKGLPDIVIPVPKGEYHGMYIELKTNEGKASKEQAEYVKRLSELGYKAIVCKGFDQTIKEIQGYFAL